MKTKKIKFARYLKKEHKTLVINSNFRNNQNYVLSDFGKYKFYEIYYKKESFGGLIFAVHGLFWLLIGSVVLNEKYNIEILNESIIIKIFWLVLFGILFLGFYFSIYNWFKAKSYYDTNKDFLSDKYIFRKRIRKTLKEFNKYDFISFKK